MLLEVSACYKERGRVSRTETVAAESLRNDAWFLWWGQQGSEVLCESDVVRSFNSGCSLLSCAICAWRRSIQCPTWGRTVMVHQKHLLSGWIKNNTNWEISVKFAITSNSNIYSRFIHCTVPEIHFLFILLSCSLSSCSLSFCSPALFLSLTLS